MKTAAPRKSGRDWEYTMANFTLIAAIIAFLGALVLLPLSFIGLIAGFGSTSDPHEHTPEDALTQDFLGLQMLLLLPVFLTPIFAGFGRWLVDSHFVFAAILTFVANILLLPVSVLILIVGIQQAFPLVVVEMPFAAGFFVFSCAAISITIWSVRSIKNERISSSSV